jgi:hypothetical protein
MGERAPYSRVYWTVRDDERLADIYPDDRHLATWLRLLIAADAMWPAPADLPGSVRRASVKALEAAGVIELLPGGLFRFHGLDAERGRRRDAAASSSRNRWGSERSADGMRSDTRRNASRDETSLDEDRREDSPLPPAGGGLSARANGTNPRAVAARQAVADGKARSSARWRQQQRDLAYYRGSLTGEQRDAMNAADAPLEEIPDWAEHREKLAADLAPAWLGVTS